MWLYIQGNQSENIMRMSCYGRMNVGHCIFFKLNCKKVLMRISWILKLANFHTQPENRINVEDCILFSPNLKAWAAIFHVQISSF